MKFIDVICSGYIDLSKRRVDPEDVGKCEDRYNKAKAVHSVLRHVADQRSFRLETLYQTVGWPLYRKYGHAYDAFKALTSGFVLSPLFICFIYFCCCLDCTDICINIIHRDSDEDIFEGLEIDPETKQALVSHVKRKLAPQPVKIRSDVEVTCFSYEGIDAIKEALSLGEQVKTQQAQVKIKLIAPPMYVMTCMTLDKDLGIEMLNQAIEAVTTCITAKG